MYGTKLCLGLNEQFGIDDLQQIRLLREIGFEAFFPAGIPGRTSARCAERLTQRAWSFNPSTRPL